MVAVVKTAVFKIHNPSRHKRVVMDFAFKQYTLAYDYLLRLAAEHLEEIKQKGRYRDRYNEKQIRRVLNDVARSKLPHYKMHGSLRESLLQDVASNILSYLELAEEDENTSYPQARQIKYREELFSNALARLREAGIDLEAENKARDDMSRSQRTQFMPMFFGRPDGVVRNRNFGLLVEPEYERFYAALYLLPQNSRLKRCVKVGKPLFPIHPKGNKTNPWTPGKRAATFILVPLEFGEWHKSKYLMYAVKKPEMIRTAYLVKRKDEYFLHISFKFDVKKVEQETIMGVDRGIINLAAWTVVTPQGDVLEQGAYAGKELEQHQDKFYYERQRAQIRGQMEFNKKESRITTEVIHLLANEIVRVALRNKSQVVVEDLKRLNRRTFRNTKSKWYGRRMRRRMGRTPYNRLLQILDYKLPEVGLNKPERINPRNTSRECPRCGHSARENRVVQSQFKCVQCGYEADADLNASHNVARRWLWIIERARQKREQAKTDT